VRESRNQKVRVESVGKLETDLHGAFQRRGGQLSTPAICNMSDDQLVDESKSILDYIMNLISSSVRVLSSLMSFVESVDNIVFVFTEMFL
jgi:DNA replication initiation complex subunit (GINS family)